MVLSCGLKIKLDVVFKGGSDPRAAQGGGGGGEFSSPLPMRVIAFLSIVFIRILHRNWFENQDTKSKVF